VQVHRDEGVTNHIGPEPCVGVREDAGEASAVECAGKSSSHEMGLVLGADAAALAAGNAAARDIASAQAARRGLRTWHTQALLIREPGDLCSDQSLY
jgi:hypothetical protein